MTGKSMKPSNPLPRPLTKEEQAAQVARFLQQQRVSFFQLILSNLLQNPNCKGALEPVIDSALKGADYALEKLYPMPKAEESK